MEVSNYVYDRNTAKVSRGSHFCVMLTCRGKEILKLSTTCIHAIVKIVSFTLTLSSIAKRNLKAPTHWANFPSADSNSWPIPVG